MTVESRSSSGHEPTYRVIRLVSVSDASWEDAARRGVAEVAKTVPTLSQATVIDMDTVIRDGQVAQFRLLLELAFQLDRARPAAVPGEPPIMVQRTLIVANRTLVEHGVAELVARRAALGPCEFHVLVPATRSKETRRLSAMATDPVSGYALIDRVGLDEAMERDRLDAHARLVEFSRRLDELGVSHTSEIGAADPVQAVANVMERASFDDIVVSILPGKVSGWLGIDVPSRIRRAYGLPVTIFAPADPA